MKRVQTINATGSGSTAIADGGTTSTPVEKTLTTTASRPPTTTGGQDTHREAFTVSQRHIDAAGNDHENLNEEYLVFENTGGHELDLSGWTVEDRAHHHYRFPHGFTLGPGKTVTLHPGSGSNTATDRYWGSKTAVWNNGGDTIIVHDNEGHLVLEESY